MERHSPPSGMSTPQPVTVSDTTSAEAFHRKLRMREAALDANLKANEDVIMELHTPAGDIINVQDVGYYQDSDTLIFQGFDRANNLCQVIAKVHSLQVVFRVVKLTVEPQERKRIGFYVDEEHKQPEDQEEGDPHRNESP